MKEYYTVGEILCRIKATGKDCFLSGLDRYANDNDICHIINLQLALFAMADYQ